MGGHDDTGADGVVAGMDECDRAAVRVTDQNGFVDAQFGQQLRQDRQGFVVHVIGL